MSLRKAELEKRIRKLQSGANEIGLQIKEFLVVDLRTVRELEKKDINRVLKTARKPRYKSNANYKGLKLKDDEGELGKFEGIMFKSN